jgi:alpha-ketoglutarate-dependent taurine dioxygenase
MDLSHSTAWTVDPERKSDGHPTREYAELGWVAHLGAVIGEPLDLDGGLRVIDEPWTPGMLAGTDLLLLPVVGRDADRPVTAEESAALATFLAAGGAVLAFGDGDGAPLRPDAALTAGTVDFDLGEFFLSEPRPDAAHVLTHDVTGSAVPGHPVTSGVGAVHVYRARPIVAGAALITLLSCQGHPVAAAGTRGAGRIVVVSNAEMFALPFLGRRDNLRFLLNAVSWLATGEVGPAATRRAEAAVGGRRFATRAFDSQEDLTRTSGPHLIDAQPFRAVLQRLGGAALPDPQEEPDVFLAEAELRYHELPRSVRHAVGAFRRRSNDYGVLIVKGLPLGRRIPATPADPHACVRKEEWLGELWLAAFASALGTPFAYRQEQSGALYQNVVPTPGNATKISSESSAIELGFHTEMGFHPYPPDYVLLLCLRSDHDGVAKTITAGVRMILPELTLRERAVLGQPLFRPGIDYSFGSPNGTAGNGPALPVLYGDPYDPCLNFDFDLMVGLSAEAEAALGALRAVANRAQRWVRLSAGDLVMIDNRRAAHARSEFTARYDGYDRWLQRMCVTRDLGPSAADRRDGGRVIEMTFAT